MLAPEQDPNLLVGLATGDDAAVYRLREDLALVLTVDFFPPVVDDPYAYGAIAVANSLSDVYAMGGTPLLGLNILGWPRDLSRDLLARVLQGAQEKAREAGLRIVGGHTVEDPEPKYGLAVVGLLRPGEEVSLAGACPGDRLVLTKPLGTGVLTTAGKQGVADPHRLREAVRWMAALNAGASRAMRRVGVHACTDVTGYGLLGHLQAMARASGVSARVYAGRVPLLPGARETAEQGIAPGGTRRNREALAPTVRWHPEVDETARLLLCDAQTSGGLLMAVPPDRLDPLLSALQEEGVECRAVVGEILPPQPEPLLEVFP